MRPGGIGQTKIIQRRGGLSQDRAQKSSWNWAQESISNIEPFDDRRSKVAFFLIIRAVFINIYLTNIRFS